MLSLMSRVNSATDWLEAEPQKVDIKELRGHSGVFHLRGRAYGILYPIETDCSTVFKIAPHGQIYRRT
jgi:mRNA-degrading endonuclease RelE of RelBE toxin-antitoxin system